MTDNPLSIRVPEIGDCVAFGKEVFETKSWEHPLKVHYLFYRELGPDGSSGVSGVCLEFGLFSWAEESDRAHERLHLMTEAFFADRISDAEGRIELMNCFRETALEQLWVVYRFLLFLFGDPEYSAHKEVVAARDSARADLREAQEENTMLKVEKDALERAFERAFGRTAITR